MAQHCYKILPRCLTSSGRIPLRTFQFWSMIHLTLRIPLETNPHICVCLFLWFDHKDDLPNSKHLWYMCSDTNKKKNIFIINQNIFIHPFFVWAVLLPLTLYVFLPSGEAMAVHCHKGIIVIILTLAYQVTILMIIHCTFGLVFLHLFSLLLDTLWQQQISMVENSLFKMKSYFFQGCCSSNQNPSNNLPYLKPEISSKMWQLRYNQSSSLFTSFTLHLGWYSLDISIYL